jgi:hypothetical protein
MSGLLSVDGDIYSRRLLELILTTLRDCSTINVTDSDFFLAKVWLLMQVYSHSMHSHAYLSCMVINRQAVY